MTNKADVNEFKFKIDLKSRGFDGFDHETDFNHLRCILKTGFLASRNYVQSHFPELGDNAWKSVIDNTDEKVKQHVRFYFYKRTPTNYRFEQNNPEGMAYLVFDYDICHHEDAYFSNGNAACHRSEFMKVSDYFESDGSFLDLNCIFDRTPMINNKEEIKRIRNSELLVKEPVYLKDMKKIVFKTEKAKNEFWSSIDDKEITRNYKDRSVVDGSYFCQVRK